MNVSLTFTKAQHATLSKHLFPGDGAEAVALLLCGRRSGDSRHRLLVQQVIPIPYEACTRRTIDTVTWPIELLLPHLQRIEAQDLAVVEIHSHPGGYAQFSELDDESDSKLFPFIYNWTEKQTPHASAIMLPDGRVFGRVVTQDGQFVPLFSVNVVGHDLTFWNNLTSTEIPEYLIRNSQLFGPGTIAKLQALTIGVVGLSGTGSPIVECLARNGVCRFVLVDPETVEKKNLNRIINSTNQDAETLTLKTEVTKRFLKSLNPDIELSVFTEDISNPAVIKALGECDILFGCVDSIFGRDILNKISSYYLIPLFDLGVRLDSDGEGGIERIAGRVDYIQPGLSSLLSRGVYTRPQVSAAHAQKFDPKRYKQNPYFEDIEVESPAVIHVNMMTASLAINDFLARLHPYRLDGNHAYARAFVLLHDSCLVNYAESDFTQCAIYGTGVGKGDKLLRTMGIFE